MELKRFGEADYQTLISWIPDAEFNLLWGGPKYSWPLTHAQIKSNVSLEQVHAFMLIDSGNKAIGFIEVLQLSKDVCRLCRVLLNPLARGKGAGKQLVSLALTYAEQQCVAKVVELAVYEHNLVARQCYSALGFRVVTSKPAAGPDGQDWELLTMEKVLVSTE